MWLHDPRGLRDNTRELAKALSCSQDGYFAELLTHADVTLQVMQILRVLERPLVSQRKKRLKVFSDVYAHIEVCILITHTRHLYFTMWPETLVTVSTFCQLSAY